MSAGMSGLRARALPAARVDARLLIGLLLVVVALVGGVSYARSLRITEPVLVAARTIPAGQALTAGDLAVSEARLEGDLRALAFGEEERSALLGRIAGETIHAGALLLRPALTGGPALAAGETAVTVPVVAESVFADLRIGDVVALLGTDLPGRAGSTTEVLLERATVYHVALDGARGLGGDSARIRNVTVVVPRAAVERVADVLVNGRVTLALVPDTPEAAP